MSGVFKNYIWALFCGLLSGVAWQLNCVAMRTQIQGTFVEIMLSVVATGFGFALLSVFIRFLVVKVVASSVLTQDFQSTLLRYDSWSYSVLLLPLLGSVGVRFDASGMLVMFLMLFGLKIVIAWSVFDKTQQSTELSKNLWLPMVFALSGFSALIYQVAWQRYLMVLLGVNIESVTLVVCLFMFGLGAGALLGGYLSWKVVTKGTLVLCFVGCELMIAVLGFLSPRFLLLVTESSASSIHYQAALALGYLLLPTLFMGATLPLLVSYLKKVRFETGESVGWLYCGSTIGSAIACFITTHLLFIWLGLHATVTVAATVNLLVVCIVLFKRRGENVCVLKEAGNV